MKLIQKPFYTKRHFFLVTLAVVAALTLATIDVSNSIRGERAHQVLQKSAVSVSDGQYLSPPTPTNTSRVTRAVPILMYHYIRTVIDPTDRLGFNLSVTHDHFSEQMAWLADHQFHTMPLDAFCIGAPLPENPIILTFDDGYDDAYTDALPILKHYGFMGTFFIVSGFIDQPRYLTSDQLHQLELEGMELGAHTVKHINLATAPILRQQTEIRSSRQSSPVFAYPAGQYTQDTIKLVKQNGFDCAVTTRYGIASEQSPSYKLPRVRISGGDDLAMFAEKVMGKR